MVLLTFSTKKTELQNKSKLTTIRKNVEYWWEVIQRQIRKAEPLVLDIWWLNPRNRHPDCYKMGQSHLSSGVSKLGKALTDLDAELDGFDTLDELLETLQDKNKMTLQEVLDWEWIILDWDWLDGYPIKKGGTP